MPAEVCGLATMSKYLKRMSAWVQEQLKRMVRGLRKLVSMLFGQDTEKKNPSTKRRDDLLKWQSDYQAVWEEEKVFEASAPAEGAHLCQISHRCFLLRVCSISSTTACHK